LPVILRLMTLGHSEDELSRMSEICKRASVPQNDWFRKLDRPTHLATPKKSSALDERLL